HAKEAFAKAIELNINSSRAYLGLGQLHLDLRAWTEAIEQFEKALLVDPSSPTAHLGIAKAKSNLNTP
ncbi:MAG: tetratricopeptide repeat protein, partial [Candidatus Latescibacterota bacterium]